MAKGCDALALPRLHFDIFCSVVDNYGDIGVCWRLARQLAEERGHTVRLWVDDLDSFTRLCPAVNPLRESQTVRSVEIRIWRTPFPEAIPGDVVIEAFACQLPQNFIASMARRDERPAWINLEYLSAEAWVEGCHCLPSPQQGSPLLKYFFFPGFTEQTGGLILEGGLPARRAAFQADDAAQEAFWHQLGVAPRRPEEWRISLFSYANLATVDLLESWCASPTPITCLVPEGTASAALASAEFGLSADAGSTFRRGSLRLRILPFLEQEDYDRLLWACDLNFVRGEDSFVRAQWAARPFVWHIYPQVEDAHHAKLEAFLERYCSTLAQDEGKALDNFWRVWNGVTPGDINHAWQSFRKTLPALRLAAPAWAERLAGLGGLASHLEEFIISRL